MSRVSCIIPAYNEAARIGAVLSVVARHPALDEVLVVDDGSTDGTKEVVQSFQEVELIVQPKNLGKSAALAEGVAWAKGEYLLFLDADLAGLTEEHITRLVEPVVSGAFTVSLSLRGNCPALWRMIGLDYISGERVLPAALLHGRHDAIAALSNFGFEVFLNKRIVEKGSAIAVVPWPSVASPYKHTKYGLVEGVRADARMMRDIFSVIYPWEALVQIGSMLRLRQVV